MMTIDPTATLALISELYATIGALRDELGTISSERDALLAQINQDPEQ